jgi:hypothetical protein
MYIPLHPLNYFAGWSLILMGFLTGAGIGLFFHREDFLGGYTSFRRRILRLGHVALVALGMLNVLFAIASPAAGPAMRAASVLFLVGGVAMPSVCFLTAFKPGFRHLFFIPVLSLVAAVILVILGGVQ